MSPLRNREGFALPMAILVIGFMTAGIVASFTRVGAEVQTVDNVRGQTAAFAMAEAGLADFVTTRGLPGTTLASTDTFTYHGGRAVVTARRIFRNGGVSLVLVSSRGTAAGPLGRPRATRTVAQFAVQTPMQMQVISSWTALGGVSKQGNSGAFVGADASGTTCGDGVTRAGVAVPDGMFNESVQSTSSGDPPVQQMGTPQEMASQIHIDWAGITNPISPSLSASPGNVVCFPGTYGHIPEYGPCGGFPSNYDNWPTVVINGSGSLPSNLSYGRGILIVTGDFTLLGNQNWDGLILVGGRIVDNGQGMINGSVITGLNVLKGENVGASEVAISEANGQKRYQFDSCAVQNALLGSNSGLRPISNAWVDNWMSW
jgi:hypothetical protein